MAIKLADVLENVNLAYPILEAHEKSIVGFYNGRANSAAQTIKLGYNGVNKVSFSETASFNSNLVALTSSYSPDAAQGLITAADADTLLTSHGGIFTVHDSKLFNDSQVAQTSGYSAAYLVQELNAGTLTVNDATRSSVAAVSELVQQFNRYESLPATGTESIPGIIEAGQNLYLAGFHETQKRTRKLKVNDLIALLTTLLADDLVSGGVVSTTDFGGGGVFGDLDGDGNVGVSDLLLFINAYGQPGTPAVSLARGITEQTITVTPAATSSQTGSGNGGSFLFTDFVTFNFPNPNSVNNQVFGWDSIDLTQGQANKIVFDERAANETWYAEKDLRVYVSAKITATAPDMVAAICVVRVITQSSANNDYEQAYLMFASNSASNTYYQITGVDGTPGNTVDAQFFYQSDITGGVPFPLDYQPEVGVFTSTLMQNNNWNLATLQSGFNVGGANNNNPTSDRIKDLEVRICLFSFAGYSTFQIDQVHAYVDEELMTVTYAP